MYFNQYLILQLVHNVFKSKKLCNKKKVRNLKSLPDEQGTSF
jgi:hypothetical protein